MNKTQDRIFPLLFVLLWSSGFIAAKLIAPYSPPFVFLTFRYVIASAVLFIAAALVRENMKLTRQQFFQSAGVAILLHTIYIGGVFYAVSVGVTSGVSAVIVSLQPVLVGVLAVPFLGERLHKAEVLGLVLGVVGVAILLLPKIFQGSVQMDFPAIGIISCVIALFGTTGGYLLQKRSGAGIPFITGTAVQYAVSAVAFFITAALTEDYQVQWTGEFIFGLSWSVLINSIASILILFTLLRHGSAQKVSSLNFLTPPTAAVMAYFLFDERISPTGLFGMALAGVGVMLVMRDREKLT